MLTWEQPPRLSGEAKRGAAEKCHDSNRSPGAGLLAALLCCARSPHIPRCTMFPCMNWQSAYWAKSGARNYCEPGTVSASRFRAGLIRSRSFACCSSCVTNSASFSPSFISITSCAEPSRRRIRSLLRTWRVSMGWSFMPPAGTWRSLPLRNTRAWKRLRASCGMGSFVGFSAGEADEIELGVFQGLKPKSRAGV